MKITAIITLDGKTYTLAKGSVRGCDGRDRDCVFNGDPEHNGHLSHPTEEQLYALSEMFRQQAMQMSHARHTLHP